MSQQETPRWHLRLESFLKAERNLGDALAGIGSRPMILLEQAGLIKLFDIAWEQGWKAMRDYLVWNGIRERDVATPVGAIRQAYATQLISNGQQWMDATKLRHTLSREYHPDRATEALGQIGTSYLAMLRGLAETLADEAKRPRFP